MTDAVTHHSHSPMPFTTTQVDWFQSEDRHAAKVIIGLMTSIFTIGLVLYGIVAVYVAAG